MDHIQFPQLPAKVTHKIEIQLSTGCWLWQGARTEKGYAIMKIDGRKVRVHRYVVETAVEAAIPSNLDLHHLCPNRHCVNPAHVQLLPHADHGELTAYERGLRSHCRNGHPLTEDNVYVRFHPDGSFRDRQCRTCRREKRHRQAAV